MCPKTTYSNRKVHIIFSFVMFTCITHKVHDFCDYLFWLKWYVKKYCVKIKDYMNYVNKCGIKKKSVTRNALEIKK